MGWAMLAGGRRGRAARQALANAGICLRVLALSLVAAPSSTTAMPCAPT